MAMLKDNKTEDTQISLPPQLLRAYEVIITPSFQVQTQHVLKVRSLKSDIIGSQVTIRGIVCRMGQLKPQIQIVTYSCDKCRYEM